MVKMKGSTSKEVGLLFGCKKSFCRYMEKTWQRIQDMVKCTC